MSLSSAKGTTHPVGQKEPNAFGLYDMHGNIWQWCQDWYREDYYSKSSTENPQGPSQGKLRLLRGGSWCDEFIFYGSAFRFSLSPDKDIRYGIVGFRVVLAPSFRTP